jgi:hypothetical protein
MELLKQMYEIHSPSGGEKRLKKFIKRWVGNNIPDAVIRKDNHDGNVYITRGTSDTYPCVVAHLDQVQSKHSTDFMAVETEDIIFGYSPKNRRREGLGADDKNGIWVALKCLEEFDTIKVAFFVEEETGCNGSGRADISWFKDCRYILQADRRGAHDCITSIWRDICSESFANDLPMTQYGYVATSGMMTDVLELSDNGVGISCINMSCGYYDPHTDDEFTVKADLLNCLEFTKAIISTMTDVYPHEMTRKIYSNHAYSGTAYYRDYYDDYYGYEDRTTYETRVEPSLCCVSDCANVEDFIDQVVWMNCEYFTTRELWPYISSELETYGVTEEMYLTRADAYYDMYIEDLYNSRYGHNDDDYYKNGLCY